MTIYIKKREVPDEPERKKPDLREVIGSGRRKAVVSRMSDVDEQHVEWLWKDRIPFGNLTVIAGDPGLGKSTMVLDLAARVTQGRPMPEGLTIARKVCVLIMTAEDGVANTVKPRLEAARADEDRVHVLLGVREGGTDEDMLSIPDDLGVVRDVIQKYGVRLLIIDPLDAFLDDGINSHNNKAMRRAMTPLKMLAEETNVAIVVIAHLNKNVQQSALNRLNGSIGTGAAARSVLLVAPDPDDEDGRVLASVKSNLAAPAQALAFHIDQRAGQKGTHVVWDGISHLSKDDLLAAKPAKARQLAINFLKIVLADEPVPASEVEVEAKKLGIKERTLRRAADDLGVVKEHVGSPGGHWQWSLPETDGH